MDELITRTEARKQGLKYYFIGEECKNGHIADRMVESTKCVECIQEQNDLFREQSSERAEEKYKRKQTAKEAIQYAKDVVEFLRSVADPDSPEAIRLLEMEIKFLPKTRAQARYVEEKYYYDNVACDAKGHFSKKYTESGGCVACYKETDKNYALENKATLKASSHRRRARLKNAEGEFTADDIYNIFVKQGGLCTGCLTNLIFSTYHADHIMPLALGGSNWPENIQLLCPTCNLEKNAKHPDEWEKIAIKKRKNRIKNDA